MFRPVKLALMELKELAMIFKSAAENGAFKALGSAVQLPDLLTKSEAFLLYGRSNEERWIRECLIIPKAASGKTPRRSLDRNKLGAISDSSNRIF